MMIFKLIIIFLFLFIFIWLKKPSIFNIKKRDLKKKRNIIFNKSNLKKWMNLTKKERYDISKEDSMSYLSKRKVLLEEIRKEYKRISKRDSRKNLLF